MDSVPASSADPLNSFNTLPDGALTSHRISTLRKNFEINSVYRMAQNAVCKVTVDDVALNRQVVTNSDFTSVMCWTIGVSLIKREVADVGCSRG